MKSVLAVVLLLLIAAPSPGQGDAVPDYAVPDAFAGDAAADPRIEAIVTTIAAGKDADEGWRVLAALGRPAVPATIRGLRSADGFGRALLMYALSESGVEGVAGIFVLGAKDPAWAVREAAAAGLGKGESPAAVATLLPLLTDRSWRVRAAACLALRRLVTRGRADRAGAIRALLPLDADDDEDVRFAAVRELGNLQATEAIPLFVRGYLESDEEERQNACLSYLTHLEGAREPLIAALTKAMGNSDDRVFLSAAEKYAELTGPKLLEDEGHVHRLLSLLSRGSTSEVASLRVADVMKKIGPKAVPVLLGELKRIYRTPSRIPVPGDLGPTVLNMVEAILKEKAAPVLAEIITEWTERSARAYAVVLATRYHATELSETLTGLYFEDRSADIRSSLLGAIAAADPPNLDRYLDHAVRSGRYLLQQRAYEILREHPEIELTGSLASALAEENRNPKIATYWLTLLQKRDPVVTYKQARRLLVHPDPELRIVGVRWVFTAPEVEDALELLRAAWPKEDGLYRDRDDNTPDQAKLRRSKVLGTMLSWAVRRGKEKGLPLIRLAMKDEDVLVRERGLEELSRVEHPDALPIALTALKAETDLAVRRQALRTIVRSERAEAKEVVRKGLTGERERDRMHILTALRAVEEAPVPDAVATALSEGKWEPEARVVAVEVIGRRKTPEVVAILSGLAESDPDYEVRQEAVRVLAESGDPGAAATLIALLPDAKTGFREVTDEERLLALDAIHALGELGAPSGAAPLIALLDTEWDHALAPGSTDRIHFDAVIQIALSLGRIGDAKAIAPMVEKLFDRDLYRDFALLVARPSGRDRNLLTGLVSALVRFPDRELEKAARNVIAGQRASYEIFRIDQDYLTYLSRLLAEPRRSGIRRPQPRRATASVLDRLLLELAPRETTAELTALENLSRRAAARHDFRRAAETMRSATRLRHLLYPLDFAREEAYYRARADLLEGIALMEEGKVDEGKETYTRGVKRDGEDPRILNLFAWWLAETGRELPGALNAALAAGRRSAGDPNVIDTLGWVLFRMDRHLEAIDRLSAAATIDERRSDPSEDRLRDPLLLYHLAAALTAAGRVDGEAGALAVLARAVALDDTLADAARDAPWFEKLTKDGVLEKALSEGLSRIPR